MRTLNAGRLARHGPLILAATGPVELSFLMRGNLENQNIRIGLMQVLSALVVRSFSASILSW